MTEIGKFEQLSLGNGLRVVSFFSGAGGLDVGFEKAGYNVVYATDIDQSSCYTLKANRGTFLSDAARIECADIRTLNPNILPVGVDLIIGGPPCQSFSASGRRAGGAAGRLDDRGTLFEAYCSMIESVQPKAFVFENVRGILATNKGKDWEAIVDSFNALGYSLDYRILDALDYGAPQQRERMFLIGHKMRTPFLFPRPLFGPDALDSQNYVTAGQALELIADDFEKKEDLVMQTGKYAHLLPLVPPGGNYLYFTAKRGYSKPIFAYRSRFSDFLYKASPTTPIKTLIASPGKYTGPFHWDNRSFTVREYMRLQGFPDGYKFVGERRERIKQIGNSVSPKISYQLAIAIAKQVFDRPVEMELLDSKFVLSFDGRKGKKAALTRAYHTTVSLRSGKSDHIFRLESYNASVGPTKSLDHNVKVVSENCSSEIHVQTSDSTEPFARLGLEIFDSEDSISNFLIDPIATVHLTAYGNSPQTVQTIWNAVDDWVIRSSDFHSLFELYGHFTEPHPVFRITEFEPLADLPIIEFARHVSKFENCSKYFPRQHLTSLFGVSLGTDNFIELVNKLRSFRFDIRCHETNIAIPKDVYMVCYPFTLPFGKQMNFSVKPRKIPAEGVLSVSG